MTQNQLNEYIEHYFFKDKTRSAIMLTGVWGSGKSYYIEYSLKSYLKEKKIDCVVVSLYGTSSLNDISKAIYMELRSIKLFQSNEVTETFKIVGKTVLKNVTQLMPMLNVNTEIDKKDLQILYESVNLTGKLIIFEDIERSQIDIIEFLGYVNNLVEQDGVKVLLVANEREILKADNEAKYNQVKEKTINDTLKYTSDLKEALKNIISSYDKLRSYVEVCSSVFDELIKVVSTTGGNLRSFIYACQKSEDILAKCGDIDKELVKIIIFSVVKYSMKYKENNSYDYKDKETEKDYPLFNSCKNYLDTHILSEKDVLLLKSDYKNYKKQQKVLEDNNNINDLEDYFVKTEDEVLQIVKKVEEGLENNTIDLLVYGKLAKLILKVANIIDYDTSKIKGCIVDNLKGKSSEVDIEKLFMNDKIFFDKEPSEEYVQLKEKMINSLKPRKTTGWATLDYVPNNIHSFHDYIFESRVYDELRDTLVTDLNEEKFVEMLSKCSPKQINEIREVFWTIYRDNNSIIYTDKNNEFIRGLYQKVKELTARNGVDKIVKYQLEMFLDNLQTFTGEKEYKN